MKTACPHCGCVFSVREDLVNKQARCRNCKNVFVIKPGEDEGIGLLNSEDEVPAAPASKSRPSPVPRAQQDDEADEVNVPFADFPAMPTMPAGNSAAQSRAVAAAPVQTAFAVSPDPAPRALKRVVSFEGNESAVGMVLGAYVLVMIGLVVFAMINHADVQRVLKEELLLGARILAGALGFWGGLLIAGKVMGFRTNTNGLLGALAIVALPIIPVSIAQVLLPESVWPQVAIPLGIGASLALVFVGYGLDLVKGAVTAALGTVLSLLALLIGGGIISANMRPTSDYNSFVFPWFVRYAVLKPSDEGQQTPSELALQMTAPSAKRTLAPTTATVQPPANVTASSDPPVAPSTPTAPRTPPIAAAAPAPPNAASPVAQPVMPSAPGQGPMAGVPAEITPPGMASPLRATVPATLSSFAAVEDWVDGQGVEQIIYSTPAGPWFGTVSTDRLGNCVVDVWSIASMQKKSTIKLGGGKNASYALSPGGDMLLRVNQAIRPMAEVWSVATGERIHQIPLNVASGEGAALGFSDKNTIAVLWKKMRDFGLEIIDMKSGQTRRTITWWAGIGMADYDCNPQNVVFTPDGKQIAFVDGLMHLELVDSVTGAKKRDWPLNLADSKACGVSSVVLSSDGKRFAVVIDVPSFGVPPAVFHGQVTDKELAGITLAEPLCKQAGLDSAPHHRFGRMADWLDADKLLLYGQLILDVRKGALVDTVYVSPEGRPAGKGAGAQVPVGPGKWLLDPAPDMQGKKGPIQILRIDSTKLSQ